MASLFSISMCKSCLGLLFFLPLKWNWQVFNLICFDPNLNKIQQSMIHGTHTITVQAGQGWCESRKTALFLEIRQWLKKTIEDNIIETVFKKTSKIISMLDLIFPRSFPSTVEIDSKPMMIHHLQNQSNLSCNLSRKERGSNSSTLSRQYLHFKLGLLNLQESNLASIACIWRVLSTNQTCTVFCRP